MVIHLIWDEWNTAHIARHHVIPNEVEELIQGEYWIKESYRGRQMIFGATNAQRVLVVVVQFKGSLGYYVVTARPANRAERRIYQTEIEEGGEQTA